MALQFQYYWDSIGIKKDGVMLEEREEALDAAKEPIEGITAELMQRLDKEELKIAELEVVKKEEIKNWNEWTSAETQHKEYSKKLDTYQKQFKEKQKELDSKAKKYDS